MTVSELIFKLREFDGHLNVLVDSQYDVERLADVVNVRAFPNTGKPILSVVLEAQVK